MSKRDCQSIVE